MAAVCGEAAGAVFPPEAGSLLTVEFIIQNGIYKAIPTRIAFDRDAPLGVTTTELPWVNFSNPAPAPALGGSGVDTKRDLVYTHGGCTGQFFITDVHGGSSVLFPTPPALRCIQNFVYDEAEDRMIALGGRAASSASAAAGRSLVETVAEIDAAGRVRVLFDLRGRIPSGLAYLHAWQSLTSFDTNTREAWAMILRPTTGDEFMLRVDVDTGDARVDDFGGANVHHFFDEASGQRFFFNCEEPSSILTSADDTVQLQPFMAAELPPSIGCSRWFVGGGYDGERRQHFVLFRDGDRLAVGVSDLANRDFQGVLPLDIDADAIALPANFVFRVTEFVGDP
jgi:hypothetical protein